MDGEEPCETSITTIVEITHPCMKGRAEGWRPKEIREIDGQTFVGLEIRDTGFSRYVFGHAYWKPCAFWLQLRGLRDEAVAKAAQPPSCFELSGDADLTGSRKRRNAAALLKNIQAFTENDALVDITLPACEAVGAPPLATKVVGNHGKPVIFVEMTERMLGAIRDRCLATSKAPGEPKRAAKHASPAPGVYWHEAKNSYVVELKRACAADGDTAGANDGKKTKYVKANDAEDMCEVERCKSDALDFVRNKTSSTDSDSQNSPAQVLGTGC